MLIKICGDDEYECGSVNVLSKDSKDDNKDADVAMTFRGSDGDALCTVLFSGNEAIGLASQLKWLCTKIEEARKKK